MPGATVHQPSFPLDFALALAISPRHQGSRPEYPKSVDVGMMVFGNVRGSSGDDLLPFLLLRLEISATTAPYLTGRIPNSSSSDRIGALESLLLNSGALNAFAVSIGLRVTRRPNCQKPLKSHCHEQDAKAREHSG